MLQYKLYCITFTVTLYCIRFETNEWDYTVWTTRDQTWNEKFAWGILVRDSRKSWIWVPSMSGNPLDHLTTKITVFENQNNQYLKWSFFKIPVYETSKVLIQNDRHFRHGHHFGRSLYFGHTRLFWLYNGHFHKNWVILVTTRSTWAVRAGLWWPNQFVEHCQKIMIL